MSKWEIVNEFDKVADCKWEIVDYGRKALKWSDKDWPAVHYVARYGRCIASDDPRLAK